MSGFETISQGILLTFALVVILMPSFIRLLRRFGMGKRVRVDGPETHYVKEGTPSMGGLLIIAAINDGAGGKSAARERWCSRSCPAASTGWSATTCPPRQSSGR